MLTKQEYKLLKRFADYSCEDVFLKDLPDIQIGRARNLSDLGFLVLVPKNHENSFIGGTTAVGRHELEMYREQHRRDAWTLALSIVAIVISLIAILAQLLQQPLSELLLPLLEF